MRCNFQLPTPSPTQQTTEQSNSQHSRVKSQHSHSDTHTDSESLSDAESDADWVSDYWVSVTTDASDGLTSHGHTHTDWRVTLSLSEPSSILSNYNFVRIKWEAISITI